MTVSHPRRRFDTEIALPDRDLRGRVVAYGHYGRPVLVFPSERGSTLDWEDRGMIAAVADLVAAGKAKLYCVDSADGWTWSDDSVPLEERARRYGAYETWIVDAVVPVIVDDCAGRADVVAVGASMGAFHAVTLALKHADRIGVAIGLSGVYDVERLGWGERGDAVYFNNPAAFLVHADGDHLEWLRRAVTIQLVVGQGQWEDTTGALESTRAFAALAQSKGLRCDVDVWGSEWPHDWPSWRAQIATHLPRYCHG